MPERPKGMEWPAPPGQNAPKVGSELSAKLDRWRPIGTAPKDGTSFMGYWAGGKHDCAFQAIKWHKGNWWETTEDRRTSPPNHRLPLAETPAV